MGGFSVPVLPDPDDEEILFEAFWVAALNARIPVMEYLISRGLDVNRDAASRGAREGHLIRQRPFERERWR